MRDYLFRGKRIDNGEWVKGYYIKATRHWHEHGIHEEWIAVDTIQNGGWCNVRSKYAVIPETVGQYTGLTDKNGKKIFEGDIVKYHDDFDETEYTSVVKFGEYEQDGSDGEYTPTECIGFYVEVKSYFVLCYPSDWEPCPYLLQRNLLEVAKSCEVIGNIHDNPELLREGERA